VSEQSAFWFPVKQYGWGWGVPARWQGWVVLLTYFALVLGGIVYLAPKRGPLTLLGFICGVTALLVAVVAWKGERPVAWRWGRETKSVGRSVTPS